jgi:hypothetical protein
MTFLLQAFFQVFTQEMHKLKIICESSSKIALIHQVCKNLQAVFNSATMVNNNGANYIHSLNISNIRIGFTIPNETRVQSMLIANFLELRIIRLSPGDILSDLFI